MAQKIWTTKADFDAGTLSDVVSHRVCNAWSFGGELNTARKDTAGCGTQTAGLSFGGTVIPISEVTEEYNGSSWSSGGDLNTARKQLTGAGTQTAGLSFGGYTDDYSAITEEYNGATWASGGDLNKARNNLAGAGTQNAGLSFGGYTGANRDETEEYDGATWASGGDLNKARRSLVGCGTQIAGLSFGGYTGVNRNETEEYNGSSWNTGGDLNVARRTLAGCGTQIAGLSFGGYTDSNSAITEEYEGGLGELQLSCSWSSAADLNTARDFLAGCGTQNAGLSFGGDTGSVSAITEEYNGTSWSAGGNLSTARQRLAGCGIQTAGLSFGGGGPNAETEEYNGTSWCTGGDLNTARQRLGGCGTQTAGLSFGGYDTTYREYTEEYDGTSWCSGGDLVEARWGLAGCGTQTAALSFGGLTGGAVATTEKYDGTVWYKVVDRNAVSYHLAGCGTQDAGLSFGGTAGADTEEYNGSVWYAGGDLISGREALAGCGTQTAGLSFGGVSVVATTEEYNFVSFGFWQVDFDSGYDTTDWGGTKWDDLSWLNSGGGSVKARVRSATIQSSLGVWSTASDLNIARRQLAGAGTQTSGLSFGGDIAGAPSADTEEYNGTSWCTGGDLNTARKELAGCGTQIAGLGFGGYTTVVIGTTEEYNGTTWAAGGSLNVERRRFTGCGTQLSGLSFGGENDGGTQGVTEEYDGAAWACGGDLIIARRLLGGAGTQTAALGFGGYTGVNVATTEEYDGISWWSGGGDLNTAKRNIAGCGAQDAALCFGGYTTVDVATTEEYNGVNWYPGSYVGGWTTGGDLNTASRYLAGCGTQTAGLSFGGFLGGPYSFITEEYDGSSWASGGDLNKARYALSGCGTQIAALSFGGYGDTDLTEEYIGGVWSSGGNLNVPRRILAGAGTQTAGLSIGGNITGALDDTEEYNGTSWCAGGDLNKAKYKSGGAGTQSAGLSFGGQDAVAATLVLTEEYDGTSWSSGGDLNEAKKDLAGCGTQDAGLSFGGVNTHTILSAITEEYDGTSWSSGSNLNVGRRELAGAGTPTAGLSFGGSTGSRVATTEEYSAPVWQSSYYSSQPQDVECPDNRWYRLELKLEAGSSPEVSEVGQGYSGSWPEITGNGNILVAYPSISGTAKVQPIITANGNIVYSIDANAKVRPSIGANARIAPSIDANANVRPAISADARIRPVIDANAKVRPSLSAGGRIQPSLGGDALVIVKPLFGTAKIQPSIGANASVVPIPIYASGRVQPSLGADAKIERRVYIYGVARIQPSIGGLSRIRPVIGAVSSVVRTTIGGTAYIMDSFIQANARIAEVYYKEITAFARITVDRKTRLYICSDVKQNILLYSRYQGLRGVVVDENFYTRDGYVLPRKRGRTNSGKYLFALQSTLYGDTVWSVSSNHTYQFHILTDEVGIAPFRLSLLGGQNRIDITRKETQKDVLDIDPVTYVNVTPFTKSSSTKQVETFVIKNLNGSITRLTDDEYSFVDTKHIQLSNNPVYEAGATYTIYYSVIQAGETEPQTRVLTSWVRSLNYLTWFGAYAEELKIIDDAADETEGNTYFKTATHTALEDNFGDVMARTEPDSKWSVEGYRELLEEYYHSYLRSSVVYKGVKDGVGNITTIPPKLVSYQNYKKWILGWQWLPNRNLVVNDLTVLPDGWMVTGGTCANSGTPLYGDNLLEVTATGGVDVVIESNAISTWKRFINRKWRLRGWLKKDGGSTIQIKMYLSEDGGVSWYDGPSNSLTSSWKRISYTRQFTKYATDLRVRFVIIGATAGRKIYLNWPALEEMRDKSLHIGASTYTPTVEELIPAVYTGSLSFTVSGNRVTEFIYLGEIIAHCGVDDNKYLRVSSSSYDSVSDITTVVLITYGLTSNLTDVQQSVDPVYWSTIPRSKAKSYHGFRVSCWGIYTLTDHEKTLVGFKEENGVNILNPVEGHPFWIKSAEAILELVEEDDFRVYSSYERLQAGQKTNMEAVEREDVE